MKIPKLQHLESLSERAKQFVLSLIGKTAAATAEALEELADSAGELSFNEKVVTTATDLNTLTTAGAYYLHTSATHTNLPDGWVNGHLIVMTAQLSGTSQYTKQIIFRQGTLNRNDHEFCVRASNTKNGSVWSGWKKLLTEGDAIVGSGAGLTDLNADNLAFGTVPDDRLPGSLLKIINVSSANTSLDNYTTLGIYYFSSAYPPADAPNNAVNGWLIVLPGANSTKHIWLRHGSNASTNYDTYIRTLTSGTTWSGWQRLFTSKDIIPLENLPSVMSVVEGTIETNRVKGETISYPQGYSKAKIEVWSYSSSSDLLNAAANTYDSVVLTGLSSQMTAIGNTQFKNGLPLYSVKANGDITVGVPCNDPICYRVTFFN